VVPATFIHSWVSSGVRKMDFEGGLIVSTSVAVMWGVNVGLVWWVRKEDVGERRRSEYAIDNFMFLVLWWYAVYKEQNEMQQM